MGYDADKVYTGTWGEVWLDNYYVVNLASINAKISVKTEPVSQSGQLFDDTKVVGLEGTGELKTNKINTYFVKTLGDGLMNGTMTKYTIIASMKATESGPVERVRLTGVKFSEVTLIDIEMKKLTEETMPFTFTGFEVLDQVD